MYLSAQHYRRSFVGYSNANYALSEVKDPVRTIKRAAPLAMAFVTTVYLFVNIAYFAAVSKADILGSRRIVAYVWHCIALAFSLRILSELCSSVICMALQPKKLTFGASYLSAVAYHNDPRHSASSYPCQC
jgi:amino acid transporter